MRHSAYVLSALLILIPALAVAQPKTQSGIASYYANRFIGHRTASGQLLDSKHLTAAHRTLPLGSVVVVTNRRNGRKVTVTVNDRGPHVRGRIIDLSPAAAQKLGIRGAGLAQVEIHVASLH